MLSDVLIPLLDPRRPGQVGAYETALDRLGEAARHVDVLVPGHGAVAEGPEVAARLAADHAYIDALRRGEEPVDARLGQDWLSGHPEADRTPPAPGRSWLFGTFGWTSFATPVTRDARGGGCTPCDSPCFVADMQSPPWPGMRAHVVFARGIHVPHSC
jgi:hypothetical protein